MPTPVLEGLAPVATRRRRSCPLVVAVLSATLAAASVAPASSDAPRSAPLPAGLAPHETGLPLPAVEAPSAPPTGSIHTPAEYARNRGLLLRWTSGFEPELVAIASALTSHDATAVVTIVVSGASQQTSAANALSAGGADLSRIAFLVTPSNSVWMRDYGPRFVLEDHELAIVDHVYNRPRPQDDVVPVAVATAWSLPRYDLPLVHGGGNFHLFEDGDAFMTELVLDENPGLTASDVETLYLLYQNLDLTIWPGFPTSFDSTRHIDMWFLPVRDKTAIVGEYPESATVPRQITEDAVSELLARGYTVFRTPGWRSGGTHFTYANAVVFNRVVLIPTYSGHAAENSAAFATFLAAFPDKTIVAIDADDIVGLAGVFHCIVMHVPDPDWIFDDGFELGDASPWSTTSL